MADTPTALGVVDASAVVKVVVPEVGTAQSVAAFERPIRWLAPRLMTVEVASALRQKVAGRALSAVDASAALAATLDAALPAKIAETLFSSEISVEGGEVSGL